MEDSVDSEFEKEIHKHDDGDDKYSTGSSDSDIDKYTMLHSAGKNRLFGRQKPLHLVLGGGKSADIILWRNKRVSGGIFAGVTVIWLLFECVGYHFLTFVCHSLILSLATLFLWSNLASFVNVSPPNFPKVILPEDLFVNVLLLMGSQIDLALAFFREVASGKDLKRFLSATLALWIISKVGSWFNFLTLFYLIFVMLQILPVLYERHEDSVDSYAEKAWIEIRKQYAVVDKKYLQKLPLRAFQKNKSRAKCR